MAASICSSISARAASNALEQGALQGRQTNRTARIRLRVRTSNVHLVVVLEQKGPLWSVNFRRRGGGGLQDYDDSSA